MVKPGGGSPPTGGGYKPPKAGGQRQKLNAQMRGLQVQKAAAKSSHDSAQIKDIRDAMRANKQMRANMIAKKKGR